ncbi:MAG: outer membrane protein, partial [Thermomicrobiales bacterium]
MNIRNTFKITTAALALVGSVAMANAADLAMAPVEPAAPIPYAFSWTGFYVGANIGYGFAGDDKVGVQSTSLGAINDFDKFEMSGVFGGVQAGYNYQMGSFVIGLEADIQASGISDDINSVVQGVDVDGKSDVNWFGT